MSTWQKLFSFVGLPVLGFAISIGAMLAARFFLFFVAGPVVGSVVRFLAQGVSNFAEQYTLESLRETFFNFTGVGWLDNVVIPFIFIGIFFLVSKSIIHMVSQFLDPIKNFFLQIFVTLIYLSFGILGSFFGTTGFFLGNQAIYLILVPLVLCVCFLNTIFDYHTFSNAIHSGNINYVFINIFSEVFSEKFGGKGEIVQANSVINWIVQDDVSVNNFFDYWYYSLRASILSFRFEEKTQFIAFIVNSLASILFFILGYSVAVNSYNESVKETLKTLNIDVNKLPKSNDISKILAFLIAIILSSFGFWWIFAGSTTNLSTIPTILHPNFSLGEESFFGVKNNNKQEGIRAFAQGNFDQAVLKLQDSLIQNRNDPEALIYLNNARIGTKKSYTIAVVVPGDQNVNAANEILRGVAQAQNTINLQGGINGTLIKVLVANDGNRASSSVKIATELIKIKSVLGVIGHFSSESTLSAGQIYQENGLVVISPTASLTSIANLGNYVFRTMPSDALTGKSLANYLAKTLGNTKAAIFFNSLGKYSTSLKNEFSASFSASSGEVVFEADLSQPNFNAEQIYANALNRGATSLVLLPNSATLDQALQIAQANQAKLPMVGSDSLYQFYALQKGKDKILGLVLAIPWHILDNPEAEFKKIADVLWGSDVNWRTAMSYDAAQVIIAGLRKSPSREGIQTTISSPGFSVKGATDHIKFLASGDRDTAIKLVKVVESQKSRSGTGLDFVLF